MFGNKIHICTVFISNMYMIYNTYFIFKVWPRPYFSIYKQVTEFIALEPHLYIFQGWLKNNTQLGIIYGSCLQDRTIYKVIIIKANITELRQTLVFKM